LSGVLMPMEAGVLSHCCSYAFAAATPELPPPLEDPPPLPPLLLLLLVLLLHAAMANAEVTAMTAARVFLIRTSPWHAPGRTEKPSLDFIECLLKVIKC
jgi:hypothetical protein